LKIHFVKAGETLSGIAERHGVTVGDLLAANPAASGQDDLKAGMKLVIPDRKAGVSKPPASPGPHGGIHHDAGKAGPVSDGLGPAGAASGTVQTEAGKADGPPDGKTAGQAAAPWPGKWPDIPKLPPLPVSSGAAKTTPCKTCQPGDASVPFAAPHVSPPWKEPSGAAGPTGLQGATPGALQHPFGACPVPAQPVTGAAGGPPGFAPHPGGFAGGPGSHPGGPSPGWSASGAAGGPWPSGPYGGPGAGAGPAAGSWSANPFAGGLLASGPWAGGPWTGMPWNAGSAPWALPSSGPGGLPPGWSGFHAPYNTPFSVNPYAVKQDAAVRTPDAQEASPAAGPAFIPPHAMPAAGGGADSATLHRADEPDDDGPADESAPGRASGRKPPGKKRKRAPEPTLKDKILRMQRGHRRR